MDELGPALRTLGINLHIPTDSTATKETIFRGMWHNYIEGLDAFLNIYDEDDDKLAKVVNIAINELISNAHNRTAARQNFERYVQENQWQIGPSQSETLVIFSKMKETLADAFAVLNNLKKLHKMKNELRTAMRMINDMTFSKPQVDENQVDLIMRSMTESFNEYTNCYQAYIEGNQPWIGLQLQPQPRNTYRHS